MLGQVHIEKDQIGRITKNLEQRFLVYGARGEVQSSERAVIALDKFDYSPGGQHPPRGISSLSFRAFLGDLEASESGCHQMVEELPDMYLQGQGLEQRKPDETAFHWTFVEPGEFRLARDTVVGVADGQRLELRERDVEGREQQRMQSDVPAHEGVDVAGHVVDALSALAFLRAKLLYAEIEIAQV